MRAFLVATLLAVLPALATAQTAQNPHYPVVVLDRDAGVIGIVDEINFRLPLAFERVLEEVPNPRTLMLHSPGGSVHAALAVASRVRGLGMTTVIPGDSGCYSACSMLFFAGVDRRAEGELGVHQISSESGNLVSGQFALADIIEVLADFDVPTEVIGIMLRTPPEDMYVFSAAEIRRFGLNGPAARTTPSPGVPVTPQGDRSASGVDYLDPNTWRGMTITGELISNGKWWYSVLRTDGTTTFMATSGNRTEGRYRIRGRSVCYLYNGATEEACRTPVREAGRIRWVDDAGQFSSYVLNVEPRDLPVPARASTPGREEVEKAIGEGQCAVIVASRRSVPEARDYVAANISNRRYLQGYQSQNGWIAISIGNLSRAEEDQVMADLKASGRIPRDSFCSQGRDFLSVVDIRP